MFGGDEWLIIVIVALVVFGAGQLPKIARNLGEAQKEFKRAMHDDDDDTSAADGAAAAEGTAAKESTDQASERTE